MELKLLPFANPFRKKDITSLRNREVKMPFAGDKITDKNQLYKAIYHTLLNGNVMHYDNNADTYIEKGYAHNPHAYTVIAFKARNLSQVPFHLNKIVNKKAWSDYVLHKSHGSFEEANFHKVKAIERVENTPLAKIFIQPNPRQGWAEFMYENVGFRALTGNSYRYGLTPSGFPEYFFSQMFNAPAHMMEVVTGDFKEPVKSYKIRYTFDRALDIPVVKILHQKDWNPGVDTLTGSSPYGMSAMSPLLRPLQGSNEAYDAGIALMKNGAPAGIISNEMDIPMLPEQVDQQELAFQKKWGGGVNINKIMHMATKVDWKAIGLSHADLEILESNKATLKDFCRVYGIPECLIIPDTATYNNIENFKKSVWTEVFIPDLNTERDGLNRWLVRPWSEKDGVDYYCDYDLSHIPVLQADLDKLSARLLKEQAQGLWSANEVRIMLGKDPDLTNPMMDMRIIGQSYTLFDKDNFPKQTTQSFNNGV